MLTVDMLDPSLHVVSNAVVSCYIMSIHTPHMHQDTAAVLQSLPC